MRAGLYRSDVSSDGAGDPVGNLDSFCGRGYAEISARQEVLEMEKFPESRIAVLEGVMGLYDGLGGVSERSSAWEGGGPYGYAGDPSGGYEGGGVFRHWRRSKGFLDYKEKSHVTG